MAGVLAGLTLGQVIDALNAYALDRAELQRRAMAKENDRLRDHLGWLDGIGAEAAPEPEPVPAAPRVPTAAVDPMAGLPLLAGGGVSA